MSDKRISQLVARVTLANNDVFPIVASGAATTNKVTLQTIDDYMQTNLDFGVTSVAMSVPTGLTVTGTPITSTGTFVVTFTAGYSIPTTAKQTQWDTAYTNRITSATAPLGIASNVISITQSGAASNGYLSSTDWNTFNNKQATITTGNLTEATSSVLTITGGTSSVLGSGTTIQVKQASGSQNGFISSTDWTTFNGKQNALSGTGIVKSTGGTISYLTDSTSNWDSAYNDKINSASVTGTTTKTLTLTQQDGGTITANWTDLNTGTVTSVGVSMPSAFSVVGSPITTSGTITITGSGLVSQYIDGTGALQTFPSGLPPTGAAGGDLSGTYPNPNVDKIHGIDMQSGTPTANDVWVYGGSPAKWQHQMLHSNQVTEDGNLFYTDARSRAAFSESVTGLDYNSTTGVLSTATGYGIPSTASQTNWTAAYDDTILSAAVTGTTTKTLTLTQRDSGTITASWTDINTDAVTSVFGRTGAIVATSGDYNTDQVTEGTTNLYYTEARVNANTNVAANTAARHNAVTIGTANGLSLSTQALSLALASASVTGALSSTDWNTFNGKQAAGNYVTTDTSQTISGAKTFSNNVLIEKNDSSNPILYAKQTGSSGYAALQFSGNNGTDIGVLTTYSGDIYIGSSNGVNGSSGELRITKSSGAATFTNSVTAASFIKTSGTSSQFLKADGSIDNSSYLTTGSASSTYLPLSGGTLSNAGGSSTPVLTITGSSNDAYNFLQSNLSSSLSAGKTNIIVIGKTQNALNCGYIGFNWNSNGGVDNYLTLGLYDANQLVRIYGSGNFAIGAGDDGYKLNVGGTAKVSGVLTLGSTISNGTNAYTLPSATGTLALTSDIPSLTGYVTLATAQTISGAKTFSNAINIRYDGGTSTDAVMRLRGTNATARTTRLQFEDYNGNIADGIIEFKIPTAGTASSATLSMGVNGAGLTFDINNAATFTSSVTAGAGTFSGLLILNGASAGTNTYNQLNRDGIGTESMFVWRTAGAAKWYLGQRAILSQDGFSLFSVAAADNVLYFSPSGAAQFLSSVTATSFVKTGGTASQYLMADGSVTTGGGGSYLPLSGGTLTGNLIMQSTGNPSQLLAKGTNTEFWVDSQYGGGTARAFINRNTTSNQATLMFTTGVSVTNGTAWAGSGVDWSMGMTNDSTSNFYIGYGDIYSAGNRKLTLASSGAATFSSTLATASRGITVGSMPAGSVIQVVSSTNSTGFSTSSGADVDTGLTLSITPTSSTSKILVIITAYVRATGGGGNTYIYGKLKRNGSALTDGYANMGNYGSTDIRGVDAINYLDSPATTSSTTYKYTLNSTFASTVYMNSSTTPSTITLMEIAQ